MVSVILECNKLDIDIRNSTSTSIFKKFLRQFVRPSPKSLFNCHNPKGVKYEIRSRLGLRHLREHKFKYSFQDTLNPFCDHGCEIETTAHFPLHCTQFYTERNTLSTKSKALILLYQIKITQILLKHVFLEIVLTLIRLGRGGQIVFWKMYLLQRG